MTNKRWFRLKSERLCRILLRPFYSVFDMKAGNMLRLSMDFLNTCWCASGFASLGHGAVICRHSRITGGKHISIGDMTSIGRYSTVSAWDRYYGQEFTPRITIGKDCDFGEYLHMSCISEITVGNGVLTGRWLTVTDNSHGLPENGNEQVMPALRPLFSKGPVKIGDNVWIGDKVTILPGTEIGDGAVIGAGSVVSGTVPPYSKFAGIPARPIR